MGLRLRGNRPSVRRDHRDGLRPVFARHGIGAHRSAGLVCGQAASGDESRAGAKDRGRRGQLRLRLDRAHWKREAAARGHRYGAGSDGDVVGIRRADRLRFRHAESALFVLRRAQSGAQRVDAGRRDRLQRIARGGTPRSAGHGAVEARFGGSIALDHLGRDAAGRCRARAAGRCAVWIRFRPGRRGRYLERDYHAGSGKPVVRFRSGVEPDHGRTL